MTYETEDSGKRRKDVSKLAVPAKRPLLRAAIAAALVGGLGAQVGGAAGLVGIDDPIVIAPPATGTTVETSERCGRGRCVDDNVPYSHPLQGSLLQDGRVPLLQAKDSAGGKRYGVIEGEIATDAGEDVQKGVVELTQFRPTAQDRQAMYEEKLAANGAGPGNPSQGPAPKLGQSLVDAMQQLPPSTAVKLMLRLNRPAGPTTTDRLQIAVARDEIKTRGDYRRARRDLLKQKQAALAQIQQPVISAVAQLGGNLVSQPRHMSGLTIQLPISKVQQLATLPAVRNIDLEADLTDDIDGQHVRRGTQIAQLINDGWDGENGSAAAISFAVIEGGEPFDDHVGFLENGSSASVRLRGRYECDSSSCDWTADFTNPGSHATGVNSIVWGDLTDNQDPSWPTLIDQKRRSGYAGEAWGYAYEAGTSSSIREAYDHILGRSYVPHVVNASWSFYTDDVNCDGETSINEDANELYEEGVLLIKTAGNNGSATSTDCTVGSPGAAIGVFTVGGHGNSTTSTNYLDVETAAIYPNSSLGGQTTEGKDRTIVDVTAYACREKLFDTAGGYSYAACGTSFSAPTVTAAAVDHIDFWKNNISDSVDDPGRLFSHLLLMGDREGQGGDMLTRYDNLWGAGRLKMRRFSTEGMDAPYQWASGETCVDDGQTIVINVNNGNTVSADVDYLKAVAWWYDPRHEAGNDISDVDIRLKTTGGTTLRSSLDWNDNKERIFYESVGGQAVQLELDGFDVPTDGTSCGSNSVKVYWAFYYEDGDRDDANGPGSLIDPEI